MVPRETDSFVAVVFARTASGVRPFGHGGLDDEFVAGSSHVPGLVPRGLPVLSVSRLEAQHVFLCT